MLELWKCPSKRHSLIHLGERSRQRNVNKWLLWWTRACILLARNFQRACWHCLYLVKLAKRLVFIEWLAVDGWGQPRRDDDADDGTLGPLRLIKMEHENLHCSRRSIDQASVIVTAVFISGWLQTGGEVKEWLWIPPVLNRWINYMIFNFGNGWLC